MKFRIVRVHQFRLVVGHYGSLAQLPPTLRGVRVCETKPREVVAFHGWCVGCFGARVGADVAASDDRAAASAAALARAAAAFASSFSRQQCLYLRPEPQRQSWLRPGRALVEAVIEKVYRTGCARQRFDFDRCRWSSSAEPLFFLHQVKKLAALARKASEQSIPALRCRPFERSRPQAASIVPSDLHESRKRVDPASCRPWRLVRRPRRRCCTTISP